MKWDTYHTQGIKLKYVYRYISFEKLIHFLETNSLFFSRMDKFEDNLEGITPYDITELLGNLGNDFLEEKPNEMLDFIWKELITRRKKALSAVQDNLNSQKKKYVSSWFLNNSESMGMWDLYAPNGYLLKFERSKLQSIVKSNRGKQRFVNDNNTLLVAGRVNYQDFNEVPFAEQKSKIKYSTFRKHIAFKHEEEYRLLISLPYELPLPGIEYNIGNIDDLEFEIIANPRMDRFTYETNKKVIGKYTTHELKESTLKLWLEFRDLRIL